MWTKQMPEWFRKNIKPESLGLVDHGAVPGWQTDAVNLTAEVMQRGYGATIKKYKREGAKAFAGANREWRAYKRMTFRDSVTGRQMDQRTGVV